MNLLYGFVGLILLLFILALLFGKRVRKRWDFEAEFRTPGGREFGEFDCEMSQIDKEEANVTFKARFKMRHESLEKGQAVQVYLDDTLILQGNVKKAGRIFLSGSDTVGEVTDASSGQVCRVVWGGIEQFRAPVRPD